MISVRNHRLLSNGNKLLLIPVAFLLFISSCDLLNSLPVKNPHGDNSNGKDTGKVIIQVDTSTADIDTLVKPGKIIRKKVYHIAVMLPFSIDDSYIENFDYKDNTTPYHSLTSTEIYEGILMALQDLGSGKGDFEINVYDTKNNALTVKHILEKPELKHMDMIIGPLFRKNLEIVSEFSRQQKIYMISPLISLPHINTSNPYLIASNSTLSGHMQSIANYIGKQYPHHKILIISPSSGDENQYRDLIYNDLKNTNRSYLDIHFIASEKGDDISAGEFSVFDTSIVIIPSFNEVFVNNALRTLNSQNEDHPMIVFGMPNWLSKFKSLRYDYLNNLHFHYSSSLWINSNRKGAAAFKNRYEKEYGIIPSEYVVKGYDLMLWTGTLFYQYGISIKKHINDIHRPEMNSRLELKAVKKDDASLLGHSNVKYYQNTYVHILRMSHFKLSKVNY